MAETLELPEEGEYVEEIVEIDQIFDDIKKVDDKATAAEEEAMKLRTEINDLVIEIDNLRQAIESYESTTITLQREVLSFKQDREQILNSQIIISKEELMPEIATLMVNSFAKTHARKVLKPKVEPRMTRILP